MGRHDSTRDFFGQMPSRLLARYFHERGLFAELDFEAMREPKPDELFGSWLALPEDLPNGLDTEFREIVAMSSEKGFGAIRDEAAYHMDKEPEALTVKEFLCLLCSESDFNGNALNQSRFLKDMWTHLDALDFTRL